MSEQMKCKHCGEPIVKRGSDWAHEVYGFHCYAGGTENRWYPAEPSPEVAPMQHDFGPTIDQIENRIGDAMDDDYVPAVAPRETQPETQRVIVTKAAFDLLPKDTQDELRADSPATHHRVIPVEWHRVAVETTCPMCEFEKKPCPGGAHVFALWEDGIRTVEDYAKMKAAPPATDDRQADTIPARGFIYTCGGCGKPYSSTSLDGPTRATCPRCNPGRTLNAPVEGPIPDNVSTMTTEKIPDGLHPKWSIDQNGRNKKSLNADAVVNDLTLDNQALRGALEMAQNDKALLARENHALREHKARAETRIEVLEAALRGLLANEPIVSCDDFDHRKKDQHDGMTPCPVLSRWNAALEVVRAALAAPSGETTKEKA